MPCWIRGEAELTRAIYRQLRGLPVCSRRRRREEDDDGREEGCAETRQRLLPSCCASVITASRSASQPQVNAALSRSVPQRRHA